MGVRLVFPALVAAAILPAQTPCPPTPAYSPCDLVFELNDAEAEAHPNPYLSVEIHAEFRSPRHRTFLMPAFWDGGRRLVIRFTPTDAGNWDYRLSGNIQRFADQTGSFTATDSGSPGFLRPANLHHWSYTDVRKPHLWMGDTCYRFAYIDRDVFTKMIDARAEQKFNHLRGLVIREDEPVRAFPSADQPNPDHFRELDARILYMNRKGITADLVLAGDQDHLARLFPTWRQRERYIRYLVSRYAPMKITWQGVQEFEEYPQGRELLKEVGLLLKKLDPYQHPRSTHTTATSAPLLADAWMNYIVYQSGDDQLGAVEHQLYAAPRVNAEFAYEDSGAGRSRPHHVDTDSFRKRLWNATMNGQYPTFGNTGSYGGRQVAIDARWFDSPGARQMTAWFDVLSRTRYWELEPYFDVDGGRATALPGIEYIVYLEKPGRVELVTERHSYQIYWFNPLTGELRKEKDDYKGERFIAEPPDSSHDWVLHLSRDGRKQGMLNSFRFESRPNLMQEVEQSAQRVPFEIVEPASDTMSLAGPVAFSVKLKRETRATRSMSYLWTGEATAEGHGYRVLATGAQGSFRIPAGIATRFPAVLNLRVTALNANGKIYSVDRVYKLTQ